MSEPQCKRSKMTASTLTQLKALTTVVADTGDFEGNYEFIVLVTMLVVLKAFQLFSYYVIDVLQISMFFI